MRARIPLLAIAATFLHFAQVTSQPGPIVFQPNNYLNITVLETVQIGYTVLIVNITTTQPTGSLISLACNSQYDQKQTACSTFNFVAWTQDDARWFGQITLAVSLDALAKPSYYLTLVASSANYTTSQNVSIIVVAAKNRPPEFYGSVSANTVELNNISSDPIITYTARDGDRLDRPIRYRLSSNPGNYFRVEDVTGRLFNTQPLLFTSPGWESGFMIIMIEAAVLLPTGVVGFGDPTASTVLPSTISLIEMVDYPPQFQLSSYSGFVDERSPVNTVVQGIVIQITDPNKNMINSSFTLFLDQYSNVFKISPQNATGQASASILVASSTLLDYDAGPQIYTFNVVARETLSPLRLSSSVPVTVNLNPNNDYAPQFTQKVYSTAISETIPSGSSVIQTLATDRDVGPYGNMSIRYKFADYVSLFKINSLTGLITVATCRSPGVSPCIDYETTQSYQIQVIATDNYGEGLQDIATVNITILDENDNPPIFTTGVFYGRIVEHTTVPSPPLVIEATDRDSSRNGNNNVTYSITGGNNHDLWTVDPITGNITAVRPINYSDSSGGTFNLSVEARDPDPTHVARALVYITVIPVNTYTPQFDNNGVYNTSIPETAPAGTSVVTIHATDGDSPLIPNGQVHYRFISGNQDSFVIDYNTGVVTVASTAKLDAMVQNLYTILVQATDLGQPPLSAQRNLYIYITPNRPDPRFVPSVIRPPPVSQASPIGTNVTTVFANNTNPNRRIFYSFIEPITGLDPQFQPVSLTPADKSMFVVDPVTGVVTVNQPLKYDRVATWQAIVLAVDNNTGGPVKTGTATIIITVYPTNDKPPVFSYPWTNETRGINKTLDSWDTPTNSIFDLDATSPNGSLSITYRLIDDYNGTFGISNQTGIVNLLKPLNISRDTDVKFVVIAVDNGQPPLTSTATVYIQLKNTNKYAPQFTLADYNAAIKDDAPNGTYVITVQASDLDYGDYGVVRYMFPNSSIDPRFVIDPVTGVISVAPGAKFNGLTEPLIILTVRAYDSPNDPVNRKYTQTLVQINVTYVNRDPPKFSQPIYLITIRETDPVGTSIVKVLATKGNSINAQLNYSITAGNEQGLFAIDPKTGSIQVQSSLTGKVGTYNLTVSATDNGTPQLTGTAFVTILVLSGSYLPPTWLVPSQDSVTFYIDELTPHGTNITMVKAINTNSPDSPISYSFTSTPNAPGSNITTDKRFQINPTTGLITTAKDIGYEGGSQFVVNVFAIDNFNTFAQRIIFIIVLDVAFEKPSFPYDMDNCTIPINWQISLHAPNSSIVGILSANLNDTGDFINYTIVQSDCPGAVFQLQQTPDRRSAQVVFFGNDVIKTPKMCNLTVRASDATINDSSVPADRYCHGQANQTDVYVHIDVIEAKPSFDDDLHTCIRDDAEIGTRAYTFENLNADKARPALYRLVSVELYSKSALQNKQSGTSSDFNLTSNGQVLTIGPMVNYKEKYFKLTASATFDQLSFSNPVVTMYIVPYSRELLVTFNKPPADVKGNISNITREMSLALNGVKLCVVSYNYHVTDQGIVDPTRTDVLMYVINETTYEVVPPLTVDQLFYLDARRKTGIIGITEAFAFWPGFIYNPVAAAIGIIIGLLLLALILFCCCCIIWTKILALFRYRGDKEPLIYKASSLGVVNPVWTPKPQTEEQVLTMPVPDGEGANRTIELLGEYNRPAIDIGDEDVIDSASRFQNGAATSGGAQSLSGYVHIEAPLTASRSASAIGTPSAYGGGSHTRQETTTIYESSATGGAHGGRESPYTDSMHTSGQMDSRASYSTSGAMKFNRGTMAGSSPPPRSHSTGTMTHLGAGASVSEPEGPVRLNDPGDTGHAKIGATLFRPGGQAYAQSVISGTTMVDQYDSVDDHGTLYSPPDARLALPLDTEVMYSHVRPVSYYDDADIMPSHGGLYQGEVRVGRSSVISGNEHLQETRFM